MFTKLSCTCGHRMDVSTAPPGTEVSCDECGKALRVPTPPPGFGVARQAVAAPANVLDEDGYEVESGVVTDMDVTSAVITESTDWGDEAHEMSAGLVPAAPPPPSEHLARRAVASNVANTRVEWGFYLRSFPGQMAICTALVGIGAVGAVMNHPAYWAMAAVGVWMFALDVAKVRRKFRLGDVCPAVVVSQAPPMVAVGTNLQFGDAGRRPAVKILHQPLGRLFGGVPEVGARLAAVSLYFPPIRQGAWADFDPQVLRCVTTDEVEVVRVTGTLGDQDWRDLEENLARCEGRGAGLYTLWDGKVRRSHSFFSVLLMIVVLAAVIAPLVIGVGRGEKVPEGSVPGRVHMDWGR